jgi:iron complex transport system substrate-binding protein
MRRTAAPRLAVLLTAAALALVGCGGSSNTEAGTDTATATATATATETIQVEHAQGTTAVPLNPQRVVTFDMASLDTLDALGVDAVKGVPQQSVPTYLEKYAGDGYTNVGTLFEPDYEALPALEPDLIIVGGRSSAAYAELAKTFTVIDLSADSTTFVDSMKKNVTTLGRIFDKQDAAAAALTALEGRIAKVKTAAADAGTGLVLLTSGGEVTAYGTGSRFDAVHSVFGVTPAVQKIQHEAQHGEAVSFEFIARANPDWLLVVDRDAATGESGKSAQQVLDNALVARTAAWKSDQVVYLDPEAWYIVGGGLTSAGTMVGQFENAFKA